MSPPLPEKSTKKEHIRFLQQAIDIANTNVHTGIGGPYGALIVHNGNIIAYSGNCVTSTLDPTAHAEISAIRKACQSLQNFHLPDCILYSSCEPCPMCLGAIYWARIRQVFYACSRFDASAAGFDDLFIYQEIAKYPEQRSIPMHHIHLPNALSPFISWQNKEDKTPY